MFKRNGVTLEVRESAGSFANLKALADPESGVNAGFVQGGLTSAKDAPGLLSIGRVAYEPLWVFHTAALTLGRLSDLKGKRVLVGPAGGGTAASGAAPAGGQRRDGGDGDADPQRAAGLCREARQGRGRCRVPGAGGGGAHHPAAAAAAGRAPDELRQRRCLHPALSVPDQAQPCARAWWTSRPTCRPADTVLLATTAAVLVREDAHRALVSLLAQAVQEVHAQPAVDDKGDTQLFQRAGEFPLASDPEFPFADEARRVYRSGPPLLQRYVPFWVATTVDRLIVSLVVLLPILIPLVRFAPQIYSWRVRRRILYWYGALKRLEAAARKATAPEARAEHLLELDRIEAAVDDIPVPLAYSDKLYELRQHIEVVRRRLTTGVGQGGVGVPLPAA